MKEIGLCSFHSVIKMVQNSLGNSKKKINSFRVIWCITNRVGINIKNLSSLLKLFPGDIGNTTILTSKHTLKVINQYLGVKIKC